MKKFLLLIVITFTLTNCASNQAINKSLIQMEENLLNQRQELTAMQKENLELKAIMSNIGDIATNMDDLLIQLQKGDALARAYFNDVVVPYMRNQQLQIKELKKALGEEE